MAVNLKVTGNGHFKGASTNLTDYTSTEDSTPIEGSDSSGGVGQIQFGVVEDATSEGSILLLNDTVELEDGSNGRTQGIVNGVTSTDGVASVTADGRLVAFMATRTTQPYTGTLGGAFTYYLSIVGITTGFTIDATITSRSVTFPGFTGNMWDYIKQMCVAQQVEIALVSSNIVLRPLRGRTIETRKNASESWSVQNSDIAQAIEVYYYNNKYTTDGLAYPQGGWNPDVSVYQVDAGAILEFDIPTNVSFVSVKQPVVQNTVSRGYSGPSSVYAVSGNDGLPITAAQWTATGGSISVSINDDTTTLHVIIRGANDPTGKYAPYRIAVSAGPSDYYSSLRIVGTGVFTDKQLLTIPTGVPLSKTATVIGATVDNPFITTPTEASTVGLRTAQKWAMASQTINATATVLNRKGDKGTANYPTFAGYFAPLYAGKTFAQFNAANVGVTFAQWDAIAQASVQDSFDNQAFGNIAGARVRFRDAMYRVRTATINASTIDYTAEADTLFGDFDARWIGKTFADFDTFFAGKTFQDFDVIPLYKAATYILNLLFTNLIPNPSFEKTSGSLPTVRKQLIKNPAPAPATTGWNIGGTGSVSGGFVINNAPGAATPYIFTDTSDEAIAIGDVITATITVRNDSGAFSYVRFTPHSHTGNVYYLPSNVIAVSTGQTVTASVQWTSTVNLVANELDIAIVPSTNTGSIINPGVAQFAVQKPLLVRGPDTRGYFDGNTVATGDYGYGWSAGANISTSVEYGRGIQNVSVYAGATAIQSTDWATNRNNSMRIIASGTGTNGNAAASIPVSIVSGQTYTIMAQVRLTDALTGTNETYARRLRLLGGTGGAPQSPQIPNVAGVYQIVWTFTATGTSTTLQLWHGGSPGSPDIWYDSLIMINGTYSGPYFDGSTISTGTTQYAWTGTVDNSTSTMSEAILIPE